MLAYCEHHKFSLDSQLVSSILASPSEDGAPWAQGSIVGTGRNGESAVDQFTIKRDGESDLRFTGEIVAQEQDSPDYGHPDYSGDSGRHTLLRLYVTKGNSFVCESINHTKWAGEHERNAVVVCISPKSVVEHFGQGRLAKRLYAAAKIENVEDVY